MTILLLGGVYAAELSLMHSLIENGVTVFALLDLSTRHGKNNFAWFGKVLPNNIYVESNLEFFLSIEKIDLILHRFHRSDPCQHINAFLLSRKFNITYIAIEAETNYDDNRIFTNFAYDYCISIHETDIIVERKKENCYVMPYGVSSLEHIIKTPKKGIACVGRSWNIQNRANNYFWINERKKSLYWWLSVCENINEQLTVFGNGWPDNKYLDKQNEYLFKNSTEVINQFKVIFNIESIENLKGALSHKLFQTMGCGIPTLTREKEVYKNLFGDSCLLVNTVDEASELTLKLLNDDIFWNVQSEKQYNFVHKNFEWSTQLFTILKQINENFNYRK